MVTPSCEFCGGTLRVCECHVFGFSEKYTTDHPPHGQPFWERPGRCIHCCDHLWGEPTGIPAIKWCTVCRIGRKVA